MKDKLSKGQGYPLRASFLKAELTAAKVQTEATLFQHNRAIWRDRPFFNATFSPPGQLVDNQNEVLQIGWLHDYINGRFWMGIALSYILCGASLPAMLLAWNMPSEPEDESFEQLANDPS